MYGLYRYVPRDRVWFLRFSILKETLRTFARKVSNIDFFLKILRLRLGETIPGRTPKSE